MTAGRRPLWSSLSSRLLILTIIFVMLVEVLVYVPSVSRLRLTFLEEKLIAAQIAALALEEAPNQMISDALAAELLTSADVRSVLLVREDRRQLILSDGGDITIADTYDLRNAMIPGLMVDAFEALLLGGDRSILVIGQPEAVRANYVEIVIDEDALVAAMLDFSTNVLWLSLIISLTTAALIYLTLNRQLVRPMQRVIASMVRFRERPEDTRQTLVPSGRRDEIGDAEAALAQMQEELRQALNQKSHLANLGTAVTKINHDLRNILATAQLASERLRRVSDPTIEALSERLIGAVDRAISLCERTLNYGKAEEPPPKKRTVELEPIMAEVAAALGLGEGGDVGFEVRLDEARTAHADPDQLFRVLLNLCRNALEAIRETGRAGAISVETSQGEDGGTVLRISDTGPGLSEKAQANLFQPFKGSTRRGGTGLGLATARELIAAHGGTVILEGTGPDGTTFRITLPATEELAQAS
ncbi:MAG: HAMP domain-containing histidine kinase [Sphingomonadales bacterium]|nr:HAMP domain-containing histidine kinase [Sphingomonadales bacterium]